MSSKYYCDEVAGFCGATLVEYSESGYGVDEASVLSRGDTLCFDDASIFRRFVEAAKKYGGDWRCISVTFPNKGKKFFGVIHDDRLLNSYIEPAHFEDMSRVSPSRIPLPKHSNRLHLWAVGDRSYKTKNQIQLAMKDIIADFRYMLLIGTRRYDYTTDAVAYIGTFLAGLVPNATTSDRQQWQWTGHFWINQAIGCFMNENYEDEEWIDGETRGDSIGLMFYPGNGTETPEQLPKVEVLYVQ